MNRTGSSQNEQHKITSDEYRVISRRTQGHLKTNTGSPQDEHRVTSRRIQGHLKTNTRSPQDEHMVASRGTRQGHLSSNKDRHKSVFVQCPAGLSNHTPSKTNKLILPINTRKHNRGSSTKVTLPNIKLINRKTYNVRPVASRPIRHQTPLCESSLGEVNTHTHTHTHN